MCLEILGNNKKAKKAKIATEDIIVYKRCGLVIDRNLKRKLLCSWFKGWHYSKKETAFLRRSGWYVYSGLHANTLKRFYDNTVWVIPKNSKYYLGCTRDIVSNKLVFKEFIGDYVYLNTDDIIWVKPSLKRFWKKCVNYIDTY